MPVHLAASSPRVRETVAELRKRLGLFSFQQDQSTSESGVSNGSRLDFGLRPGSTVECLSVSPGSGAHVIHAIYQNMMPINLLAMVDPAREFYPPALAGWGVNPTRMLLICPHTQQETCWAIEQCLRCPGVSATWAWIDQRVPTRIHRRWQLATEVGGGMGIFFRPESARREPAWTDLRLLVTPLAGGQGERRRVRIDVLYRRGGLGGPAQVWEIDHAEGLMRLVSELADPATEERQTRA